MLRDGASEDVRVSVLQPGAFLQNEHVFPRGPRLSYGMRVDVPLFMDRPERRSCPPAYRQQILPVALQVWGIRP